jgi:hypothetical protein
VRVMVEETRFTVGVATSRQRQGEEAATCSLLTYPADCLRGPDVTKRISRRVFLQNFRGIH